MVMVPFSSSVSSKIHSKGKDTQSMGDTTVEYENLNCITILPNATITSDAI